MPICSFRWFVCLCLTSSAFAVPAQQNITFKPSTDPAKVFVTPSAGLTPVINAITPPRGIPAPQSIDITIFHLSFPGVVSALIAAQKANAAIRIIVDSKTLAAEASAQNARAQLTNAKIEVRASSSKFSLTHQKSMIIDHRTAYILSMNLTDKADVTRDYGIVTEDPNVVSEMEKVFESDWANAANDTGSTPPLQQDDPLIWSNVTARAGIKYIISHAKKTLKITSESMDDPDILKVLQNAGNAFSVQVIGPECLENPNRLLNYPFLKGINSAHHGSARVMPDPATAQTPYMHGKMILADDEDPDNQLLYVGSINLTKNSVGNDRELGVLITDGDVIKTVAATFDSDWQVAKELPANPSCEDENDNTVTPTKKKTRKKPPPKF